MPEISPAVKIRPRILNLNNTTTKTLADLRAKLQTGSILSAVVSDLSSEEDVIFTTTYGQFAATIHGYEFDKGDTVNLRLIFSDNELKAEITKVNNHEVDTLNTIKLNFIDTNTLNESRHYKTGENPATINMISVDLFKGALHGQIKYIDLTKINKDSLLYQILKDSHNGTDVSVKITNTGDNNLSPYKLLGQVVAGQKGEVLIKTQFGIISLQGDHNLPIGKETALKIISVGGNVVKDSVTTNVMELYSEINKNIKTLQTLSKIFYDCMENKDDNTVIQQSHSLSQPTSASEYADDAELINYNSQELENAIKEFNTNINTENFQKLAKVYHNFKNTYELTNVDTQWNTVFVPVPYDHEVLKQKIFVQKQRRFIRFVVELCPKELGPIQLYGLIKLNENSSPTTFDLRIKHESSLSYDIKTELSQIFSVTNNGAGTLSFEKF